MNGLDCDHPEAKARIASLTERELEVVALICTGLKNQAIGDALGISVITVRHHLSRIFRKLKVTDRFGLAFFAFRYGLAKLPTGEMPDRHARWVEGSGRWVASRFVEGPQINLDEMANDEKAVPAPPDGWQVFRWQLAQ